jgi:hypothetical protein
MQNAQLGTSGKVNMFCKTKLHVQKEKRMLIATVQTTTQQAASCLQNLVVFHYTLPLSILCMLGTYTIRLIKNTAYYMLQSYFLLSAFIITNSSMLSCYAQVFCSQLYICL